MAVGDGGFKTAVGGFDKNEVNAYISDLRKKMRSMEEEVKANNKKTEEALKLAEEADERIKAAVKEVEDKLADVEKQLSIEQERAAKYKGDVDSYKKELEQEKKKMSEMLSSGKGVSAEAQKAYNDVISKAKADAQDIIDEANAKADGIIAAAEERRAAADKNTNTFLDTLKAQIDSISAGYKSISESAAELLGAEIAPIEVPVIAAPKAKPAPVAVKAEEPAPVEEKKEEPAPVEEKAEEPAPVEEKAEEPAPVEKKAEPAPVEEKKDEPVDDMPAAGSGELASFDDVWGGSELAQTIYNNEKENAVPLVNPEQKNLFGEDLFKGGEDIVVEELKGDDFEAAEDEVVEEIKPLDVSDVAEVAYNDSFDNDLLSQTMPSGSMGGDVNESLLEAVKAAEAAFAVQPSITELDMEDNEADAFGGSEDFMKALREAEEALNNMAAPANVSMDDEVVETVSSDSSSDGDNPWADLQKQFEAMEQTGAAAAAAEQPAQAAPPADPAAPSADDASIWDFGGGSSDNSDDDMSGDMFGGFGGF